MLRWPFPKLVLSPEVLDQVLESLRRHGSNLSKTTWDVLSDSLVSKVHITTAF